LADDVPGRPVGPAAATSGWMDARLRAWPCGVALLVGSQDVGSKQVGSQDVGSKQVGSQKIRSEELRSKQVGPKEVGARRRRPMTPATGCDGCCCATTIRSHWYAVMCA